MKAHTRMQIHSKFVRHPGMKKKDKNNLFALHTHVICVCRHLCLFVCRCFSHSLSLYIYPQTLRSTCLCPASQVLGLKKAVCHYARLPPAY